MVILALAKGQGWISADTFAEILAILGGFGLSSLRAGTKADTAKAVQALLGADCGREKNLSLEASEVGEGH